MTGNEEAKAPLVCEQQSAQPQGYLEQLPETKCRLYVTSPISPFTLEDPATSGRPTGSDTQGGGNPLPSPPLPHPMLVVLLTNSLGLESKNNLLLADMFADKLSCTVVTPDLFDSDPLSIKGPDLPATDGPDLTVLEQVKRHTAHAFKGFLDEMWLARHTHEKVLPRVVEALHELVRVYNPDKLAVVGYSFGGPYALELLSDQVWHHINGAHKLPHVTAGVVVQPSFLQARHARNCSKPVLFVTGAGQELHGCQSMLEKARVPHKHVILETDGRATALPQGFAVPGDFPAADVGDLPQQALDLAVHWIRESITHEQASTPDAQQ